MLEQQHLLSHAGRRRGPYGMLAEFAAAEQVFAAAGATRAAGYRRTDAFSPFPIEGLSEELGFGHTRLPLLVLCGAILGGLAGYGFQYWVNVIEYPLNIGGRPLHSWPAFIPVTFETTILGASLTAVLGMLALNGLPTPHHPLFAAPGFDLASRDRFFLLIEARDPLYERAEVQRFLETLGPLRVSEVMWNVERD